MMVDFITIILLALGGYLGFKKGLMRELFSFFAFLIAKVFTVKVVHFIKIADYTWLNSIRSMPSYVVFTLSFIAIVEAIYLMGKLFSHLIQKTTLGNLNQALGALLGICKWAFYISACIWFADFFNIVLPKNYTIHTFIYPYIQLLTPTLMNWLAFFIPILAQWLEALKEKGIMQSYV